jgi:CRISPR/Cas system Type II protein with McrA/HNH and RuvC-like nuclease domain
MLRRSLRAVVDPHPGDSVIAELWSFFDGRCAYCGTAVAVGSKNAHLDHLEPDSSGGSNHISNRVPSCADCNEKEKRELPWLEFLRKKADSIHVLEARRERILAWQGRFPQEMSCVEEAACVIG